jgi:hypothetical protein
MSKGKDYFLRGYEKTNILSTIKSKHGFSRGGIGKKWGIWMMTVGFLFCFCVSSEAGLVYGRLMRDGQVLGNRTFTLTDERGNSIRVQTDSQGNYRIMIPPGIYRVTCTEGNVVWGAEIRSYPNEVNQNIQLRQRR